jgi:hypothetical protein
MYAFTDQNGSLNQSIETGLSRLEDQFEKLRQDKIMGCAHLTDEDKATLCLFVATAHFRTRRSRHHWQRQWGEVVQLGDGMQRHLDGLTAEEKASLGFSVVPSASPGIPLDKIRPLVQQPLLLLPLATNREACWLSDMTITILCASDECGFITSDAPVVWFDPELHKMPPFYRSLALGSPTIEVTMPIAPSRLVLFTHGRASEGYFPVVTSLECGLHVIDDLNRRARFHCDSHFVANSDRKKDIWFDSGSPPPGRHS